jgi:hypothetical protein
MQNHSLVNKCDDVKEDAEKLTRELQNGWTLRELLEEVTYFHPMHIFPMRYSRRNNHFEGGTSSRYDSVTTPNFSPLGSHPLKK